MRKLIISPEYGAGWVSWNSNLPTEQQKYLLEYEPIVKWIEKNPENKGAPKKLITQVEKDFKEKFHYADDFYICVCGLEDEHIKIVTVPDNQRVRIEEYDGAERVVMEYNDWL